MNTINENIVKNKFTVEQRFEFLAKFTKMVANKEIKSLVVLGEGGLGKTFTIDESLNSVGFKKEDLYISKGTSTARGLFETLYDNNGKLIIFDDNDGVFGDDDSSNILKAALDSYDHRIITWSAKMNKNSEYPKQFEFTGRIIFISNLNRSSIAGPVLDRAFVVDLEMTIDEKIDRIKSVIEGLCKNNNFCLCTGIIAINFIEKNKDEVRKLSFRKLIDIMALIKSGGDWESAAKYLILN